MHRASRRSRTTPNGRIAEAGPQSESQGRILGVHLNQFGQGTASASFVASARDGSEADVFIKTLRPDRVRNRKARDRFRREVLAYETLEGLGPPQLIDHNASQWRDRQVHLYTALEYIQGDDLKTAIESQGPLAIQDS